MSAKHCGSFVNYSRFAHDLYGSQMIVIFLLERSAERSEVADSPPDNNDHASSPSKEIDIKVCNHYSKLTTMTFISSW